MVIRGTFQVLTAGLVLTLKAIINATNARRQTDGEFCPKIRIQATNNYHDLTILIFLSVYAGPHGGGVGSLRGHEGSEDGSGRQRRRRLMLVTRCTFSLRSHRTAYFSQALLRYDHKQFNLKPLLLISMIAKSTFFVLNLSNYLIPSSSKH